MNIMGRLKRQHIPYWLDSILIISTLFLAFVHPPSLQDFERRCRETPKLQEKEKIALAAVEFLVRQDVPDSIVNQVKQAVAKEELSLPAGTALFPEIPAAMDDSLAGLYEARFADILPKLYWMRRNKRDSVRGENFTAAREIAAKLEAWANSAYWVPLMDFLEKADDKAWQRWRAAAKAADLSRKAFNDSNFELAKILAAHGLGRLAGLPDHRLYIDLCYRLQNAIAEDEAVFNLGFALGDWIIQTSMAAKYYLRAVGMKYNFGNQYVLTGRYDEALEILQDVLQLTQRWRHIQSMRWYQEYCYERILTALYEMGDYNAMLEYLSLCGQVAKSTRQKVLYYIICGQVAQYLGNFETAEKEFQQAIACGQGDEKTGTEPDPLNVFYAYLYLGDLFLEYKMPDEAISFYNEARNYGDKLGNFLNAARMSECWLRLAQAFIRKNDTPSAKKAIAQAQQFVLADAKQFIDSPHLAVKNLLAAATFYEDLGQFNEAHSILMQVRQICRHHSLTLQEIDAVLRQAALSLKMEKEATRPVFPSQEIEELLVKVKKNGNKRQLVNALALAVEAANGVGQFEQAQRYGNSLFLEVEALSRFYDKEQRLVFFQHSVYENVKAAIKLDVKLGRIDSAFVKLDYTKTRALRRSRLFGAQGLNEATPNLPYVAIADLQQRLRADEAIIDYMVAEDTLYAFALTRSALQLWRIACNRRHLQTQVNEYLNALASPDKSGEDYNEKYLQQKFLQAVGLSHALYNQLLGGMAGFLEKINRLYIVPDEFLHALPFNTLTVHAGLEPDFLINRKTIMYLPAASLLAPQTHGPNRLHFLASVDSAMYGASKIVNRLTGLLKENVSMRTLWDNQAELEDWLASGYEAYFFYAHAEANWDDPWQSYIQFPLNAPRRYGKLTYADVDSIDWRKTEIVILAGCETTGNRIYNGAGLSGLQRSFLAGGAKQVLATLWKVDAAQVEFQMTEFLKNMNLHGDAMLALQNMQQIAIAELKTDPYLKYPHPRYWGAYNLTGTVASSLSANLSAKRALQ